MSLKSVLKKLLGKKEEKPKRIPTFRPGMTGRPGGKWMIKDKCEK